MFIAPPSQQPRWRYPNSPEPKKARKFHVSLNHTPFESKTSQKAPFAPRATIGGSTTLRGKDFSPATYNSLSDPHLNPYFARKFGKSASLRETGLSRTKVQIKLYIVWFNLIVISMVVWNYHTRVQESFRPNGNASLNYHLNSYPCLVLV